MKKEKKEKKPKVILTSEQKKQRRKKNAKKGVAITGLVVLSIAMLFGTFAMVTVTGVDALIGMAKSFDKVQYTDQLKPTLEDDGYYTFTTDNEFKIMQLTDIHIGGGFASQKKDSWAINAVAAMITAEKPDLVIATGDIAYPVPFQAGTFNNLSATRIFANLMEKLGVYWTFTFGNHDTEAYSYYDRKDICEFYENSDFQYNLFQRGPSNIDGFGNSFIKIKNTQGLVTQAITTIDSHSYTNGDILGINWYYDNIHQNQVDWYKAEIDKINASNQATISGSTPVKSLAFFHIPLTEYLDAYNEYINNDMKDTENVKVKYGKIGEKKKMIYCGIGEDEFFEVASANGLQGVFTGHDHLNNISMEYKGVRLTYGMSIDYLAYVGIYKQKEQRGCTIVKVQTNGTFDCYSENYYQSKYVAKYYKQ